MIVDWISVNDSVPEDGQIVYFKETGIDEPIMGDFINEDRFFYCLHGVGYNQVTHWCSIPLPANQIKDHE